MNLPVTDDSKKRVEKTLNLSALYAAPSLMNTPQKLVLFSLILGTVPTSYLEIGTAKGGSAAIVDYAADVLGIKDFKGVCIDIDFERIEPDIKQKLSERFTFISKPSGSQAMHAARRVCDSFDIVLIDALHDRANALFDILTIYPYVSPGGMILLDDANYFGVREAIKEAVRLTDLADGGLISRHGGQGKPEIPPAWVFLDEEARSTDSCVWGGLHMLRKPQL